MRTKVLTKVVTVILAGKVNLLYDEFTDNRAAGAVNGTAAKPGAGVRYVTDPTDKISIATRILKLTSAGGWDISSLHYRQNDGSGYARAADTVLEFDLVSEGTTLQVIIGWFNSTTAVIANTEHTIFLASNRVYVRNATANSDIADMEEYILYRFRLVLQAAGCKFYVSGGDFGIFDKQYTLLHTDNTENTATLYPTLVNNTGGFDIDNVFAELIDDTPTAALDTALLTAITAWQGDAARIHTAGLNEVDWAETSNVTGVDASGRTYISPTNAIMQYGYIMNWI